MEDRDGTVNASTESLLAAEETEMRRLNAARDAYPDWEITETADGYIAVPRGTEYVFGLSLDNVVMKLRQREG